MQVITAALVAAVLGTALGLFVSAFAYTEFQAFQFMLAFILPQLLVCGLFAPRETMAQPLQWFANVMPMTYSVDAVKQVTTQAGWTGDFLKDVLIVGTFAVGALLLGALTIRRQKDESGLTSARIMLCPVHPSSFCRRSTQAFLF